jgi:hypothetical protein
MKLSRRKFLLTAAISSLGIDSIIKNSIFANSQIPNSSSFTSATSELIINNPSEFKILQLTDIHFFAETTTVDWQTFVDLSKLVEFTKPDIIVVTGDFWHDNPAGRGGEYMNTAISIIERLGIPWAFTWGNHDQLSNYENGHLAFTNEPHSLYSGGSSNGNYVIEVKNQEGELLWDLICMNSSIGGGSTGLASIAQAWISELVQSRATIQHALHAFGFFHIPVPQYQTVWDAGLAPGVKYENVYSGNQNDSNAFNLFKNLETMRACFCGHDHVNDYGGMLEGIDLVYGRASGYQGYGGEQVEKGGKLITANCETGEYSWKSIPFELFTNVNESKKTVVDVFQMEQNYPNPFNPTTNIRYALSQNAHVRLSIFDITGKRIKTLVNNRQSVGIYTINWNGDNYHGDKVAAGTYYYQLLANNFSKTKSMVLIK